MEQVGILGSGQVGEALANGFLKHGYRVMRGSREPSKLNDWKARTGDNASIGTFAEAAAKSAILVLAVKGSAAESVVALASSELHGKLILDATNPIDDQPPENGILRFFTGPNESLMERLQQKVPEARFVKAFSCIGSAHMVNPTFQEGQPTMFICGNHTDAKAQATGIIERFGFHVEDMGGASAARAIEPLCMLWCIPGFLRNEWNHAFAWLKK